VHDRGVVAITADRAYDEFPDYAGAPKKAADLGADSNFCSADANGHSICLDFNERRVTSTA